MVSLKSFLWGVGAFVGLILAGFSSVQLLFGIPQHTMLLIVIMIVAILFTALSLTKVAGPGFPQMNQWIMFAVAVMCVVIVSAFLPGLLSLFLWAVGAL